MGGSNLTREELYYTEDEISENDRGLVAAITVPKKIAASETNWWRVILKKRGERV